MKAGLLANRWSITSAVGHSWRIGLYSLRDRVLSSARFQRWAAAFPLTRPVARRRARELFDLCAGFVYSQVLLACVQLRLFEIIANDSWHLKHLAERMRLNEKAARTLLEAAVSLRLLERRGSDCYGLGVLGAAMNANPGIAAMVAHHALVYADLRDPVTLLRGEATATSLSRYWPYARADRCAGMSAQTAEEYSALMSVSLQLLGEEILTAYPLRDHLCLLDVGGGDGTFLSMVALRAPQLRLMCFDLPEVARQAELRIRTDGLSERAAAYAGDFRVDALPRGADLISLVRVIHDHDDDVALKLLRAVHAALDDPGTVLIAEPLAGKRDGEASVAAYFGFYLLAMGSGRPRSPGEIEQLLRQAGFCEVRRHATRLPLLVSVLSARKSRPTVNRT